MEIEPVTARTSIADLLAQRPQVIPVFLRHHMSCVGCAMSPFETVASASQIYGLDPTQLLAELAQAAPGDLSASEPPTLSPIKESLMSTPYTFFPAIAATIESIPTDSIVSRTVYRDDQLKSIVFAFAPGQELSEHTASVPAIIQILEGECELVLGGDRYDVQAGAWARMPANMPHSVLARTPVKMLLIMLA